MFLVDKVPYTVSICVHKIVFKGALLHLRRAFSVYFVF